MNSPSPISRSTWQCIERLVNGDCDDSDILEIEAALRGNVPAQEIFLEYCQLHLDLSIEIRAAVAAESVLQQVAKERRVSEIRSGRQVRASRFRGLTFCMSLPAMLMIGGCLLMTAGGIIGWRFRGSVQTPSLDVAVVRPQTTPVAYLVSANGCEWGSDSSQIPLIGRGLGAGDEITLVEGIAEFRLENGVLLSIEGPAAVVLSSPSSMNLDYGKVTAHIRWALTDFQAHMGSCCVSASDAEFGLYREGDKGEVHVFSGEVRTELRHARNFSGAGIATDDERITDELDATTAGDAPYFTIVPAGSSLSLIEENENWRWTGTGGKAEPDRFAIRLPMASSLPVSAAYVDAVMASKPIGYWRFAADKNSSMANEVVNGSELKVIGKLRLTGSTENSALEFPPGSTCFLATPPLDGLGGEEFSVELWVKPSHAHWGGMLALVSSEPAEDQAVYVELMGPLNWQHQSFMGRRFPGTIHILHRNPPSGDSSTGISCFSQSPYRHRRWQHVVATKANDKLRLYVNGELSAKARDTSKLATGLRLVVGRLGTFSYSRRLVGQLDEVAVYDRALTDSEISGHYRAVEWNPEHEANQLHNGI